MTPEQARRLTELIEVNNDQSQMLDSFENDEIITLMRAKIDEQAAVIERQKADLSAVCEMLNREHQDNNPYQPVPDWVTMAKSLADEAGRDEG